MSYESYEPYEEYEQQPPSQQPYENYDQQQYQEYQQYEQPQQPYGQQQPYEQQAYQQPYEGQYQDQQWAQSGLGWEQQAWNEAQAAGGYQYTQVNELSGTDFQQYRADLPRDMPVPDYPPEYQRSPEYTEYADYAEEPAGFPHQRAEDPVPEPEAAYEREPEPAPSPPPAPRRTAPAPTAAAGRGSFGAAGLGALAAVAAIASTGALLVVVALIQAGIAIGWQQAMGARERGRPDRRAMVLTSLIGWAATAAAFKLTPDSASLGIPAALGVGFLLLAADQMTRRGHPFGDGERVAGLGIAVAGGLFAVLPAGFVVAERIDSALTGACASAAALGVLCCALLGRNPVRGIVAALVFGAGVGAYAAKALQADGGLRAGALGGAVAALAAATAVGALDRIVTEAEARGSTRIVSQALPVALSAVGALIASAVFR
ncbi:hypothetical protein [Actinospica sp.]|jgi:hypothetical protein|uniref:hypothetical protein n=1 Tax=Actinospica sp. TaxID=1872142 RepID=UPI002CE441D7|nr:hypothetical protein [Actinospica sp.]HWG22664.1 hypothetical protein [Actinospica sp.]